MTANAILLSDFRDIRFRSAFQMYFSELGISVRDWEGLFREMDEEKANRAFLLLNAKEEALGFLQFQITSFSNWFFEEPLGFIREFWVHPSCRRQGYGGTLLRLTEAYFMEHGAYRSILTADDAVAFYLARGYNRAPGIKAKNHLEVLVKPLF